MNSLIKVGYHLPESNDSSQLLHYRLISKIFYTEFALYHFFFFLLLKRFQFLGETLRKKNFVRYLSLLFAVTWGNKALKTGRMLKNKPQVTKCEILITFQRNRRGERKSLSLYKKEKCSIISIS